MLPGRTTILREYPAAYSPGAARGGIPYYPVPNAENQALYQRYREILRAYPGLTLCGRLAEYRYCNMDAAVERALDTAEKLAESASAER